jgi:serine/threonine protein kinase
MTDRFHEEVTDALADQYGYKHRLAGELARGGQGAVYRTADPDLAIKQPLGGDGAPDHDSDLAGRFASIRTLPLPRSVPVSLPLATLRDEPGYVMRLLSDMRSFGAFELSADRRDELNSEAPPSWLAGVKDPSTAATLSYYTESGSTKRRLWALSRVAGILARLHASGLVYGDISPNNCFIGGGEQPDVWLIDADNLRFELVDGGNAVYTPRYGAPEIVQARDRSRPRTDCWAFSVMAFETLALVHPFIGKKVLDPDDDGGGWDAEPVVDGAPTDLDEQAYAGYLPFVDDDDDDSNPAISGLPRSLVATTEINTLFQETFCAGRTRPWRRPAAAYWALELTRAHDQSLTCDSCRMSFYRTFQACPYCGDPRPGHVVARTGHWELVLPKGPAEITLPHRLFNPFSFEYNGRTEYEAIIDPASRRVSPVRGTSALPQDLTFEFVGDAE